MRLFIGIPLSPATSDSLVALTKQLRAKASAEVLRWSARESWHITLQFLGNGSPEQYDCIVASLREVHHPQLSIQLGAPGIFDRAGILFVDVGVTPQLTALQQAVIAATAPCGFAPEDRPYHPHITLARRRGKSGGRELRRLKPQIRQQQEIPTFTADSFLLYESRPTPEGSCYEIRERFPLDSA
jgi:RNA 2',3'-cyclic 3'-phosphodiesterase